MMLLKDNPELDLNRIEEFKNFDISELFNNEYLLQIGGDTETREHDGFLTIDIVNGIPQDKNPGNGITITSEDIFNVESFNPLVNIHETGAQLYNISFTESLKLPIMLVNHYTGEGTYTPSNIRFSTDKEVVLNILETSTSSNKILAINNREFYIKNSTINYSRVDTISEESSLIYNYYGDIDKGNLNVISLNNSGFINMNIWDINLVSPEAICNVSGIIDIKRDMKHGTICKIHHIAKETVSNQEFRHILDENSYGMYDADSIVLNSAKGSSTSQKSKSIMLSKNSRVYNKPRLNIFTGEVKATHGASVGKLNQDDIFYLKQRGLPEYRIKKLLINAFMVDILDRVESIKVREFIYDKK